eukprot:m.60605 g.60605  ORF g.60605 m.60605 type:complete len:92 (-) comp9515_c0_seq1:2152-2427(-)
MIRSTAPASADQAGGALLCPPGRLHTPRIRTQLDSTPLPFTLRSLSLQSVPHKSHWSDSKVNILQSSLKEVVFEPSETVICRLWFPANVAI